MGPQWSLAVRAIPMGRNAAEEDMMIENNVIDILDEPLQPLARRLREWLIAHPQELNRARAAYNQAATPPYRNNLWQETLADWSRAIGVNPAINGWRDAMLLVTGAVLFELEMAPPIRKTKGWDS